MILASAATVTLASCLSSGGLARNSALDTAARLTTSRSLESTSISPESWPSEAWWTTFGDHQLDELERRALSGQPSLRLAAARVRQAEALVGVAGANRFPQVGASLKSTRQRYSANSTVPKPLAGSWDVFSDLSLGVSYEIDFWGKNQATFEAALNRAQGIEVDYHAAQLLITTSIARTYLRLAHGYAQRDLAEATLKEREKILQLTQQRVAAQIDSKMELKQAEAALPATRSAIASFNELIALTEAQLAQLVGEGPDWGMAISRPRLNLSTPVSLPSNIPAELIGRRPDLVAQRWRVEAASKDIEVAKAQFYPNVSLTAFMGFQSLGLPDLLTAGSRVIGVGPAISLPIFDGGRLRGNLAAHQAEYDIAVEQYNGNLIAAVHDVVNQLTSMKWLREQIDEQHQALILAQEAFELSTNRYKSGVGNYLQVLSAESLVLTQKRLLVEQEARGRELTVDLIRALGGGYVPEESTEQ